MPPMLPTPTMPSYVVRIESAVGVFVPDDLRSHSELSQWLTFLNSGPLSSPILAVDILLVLVFYAAVLKVNVVVKNWRGTTLSSTAVWTWMIQVYLLKTVST